MKKLIDRDVNHVQTRADLLEKAQRYRGGLWQFLVSIVVVVSCPSVPFDRSASHGVVTAFHRTVLQAYLLPVYISIPYGPYPQCPSASLMVTHSWHLCSWI